MGKRDLMISLKVYIIIDLRNTPLIHLMMWFTEKENMSRVTRPKLETLEKMQVKLDIDFCARRKFSWQCPANPFSLPLLDPVSFFRSEEGNSYLPNSLSVANLDGHKLWHCWWRGGAYVPFPWVWLLFAIALTCRRQQKWCCV